MQVRLGVDIGGTFTDVALECRAEIYTAKILTTVAAPEIAILEGISKACAAAAIEPNQIELVIHGTTLATNALIERRGAKTALLTTRGFRDVVEMRTENRFEQYDLNLVLPPPLVARDSRFVVDGRIGAKGRELIPLDETEVAAFADQVSKNGYESIAVGFLHSYANPDHERRAREIIHERNSRLSVSISSEVSPQMREFDRFSTVCANAFVRPLMESYIRRLIDRLSEIGATCPVFMIHSGGGLVSAETAMQFPVRLLESGPAGGAIYAADIAERHGLDRILSFDMGGTTAKICLVENFVPRTARTFEVARTYRFKKGSGQPISIPAIEMVEIGAGGGSCASVDSMRQIRVGPESAGSEPGPACYRRGGSRPTVTDADLILGKIDIGSFAGGKITLSAAAAADALQSDVGIRLGMDSQNAAASVVEVVDETMAAATREHAIENGKDLATYTMVAFGGAAPLHAARLCEKLGIERILVPPNAGVGSAIGFLRAPFGYEAVRSEYMRLSAFDTARASQLLGELKAESAAVARAGNPAGAPDFEFRAFMRYTGQGWEVPVVIPDLEFERDGENCLRQQFEIAYRKLYSRPLEGVDIEILSWSVSARIRNSTGPRVDPASEGQELAAGSMRSVFDARVGRFVEAAVFKRSEMESGEKVSGPAAVVEADTTTIVTPTYRATMQSDASLMLQRKELKL